MRKPTTSLGSAMVLVGLLVWSGAAAPARAGDADVKYVRLIRLLKGWEMHVTIAHRDTGWTHWVDRWELFDEQGRRIGIRRLEAPHKGKRRFTERMEVLSIPAETKKIVVRAHDLVHGLRGLAVTLDFTQPKGKDYEIVHQPWDHKYQVFLGEGRFMRTWYRKHVENTLF